MRLICRWKNLVKNRMIVTDKYYGGVKKSEGIFLDYQLFVKNLKKLACVVSIKVNPDGTHSEPCIEAANDFTGELLWDDSGEFPATNKPDKATHGMGLMNIRRCAQKYKGEINIQTTEENGQKRFLLTVMLYEKDSD